MSASRSLPRSRASSNSQHGESSEHQSDANNYRTELRSCVVHMESVPQNAEAGSPIVLSNRQQRYLQREQRREHADILQLPPSDNEGDEKPTLEGQQNSQEVGNVPNCSGNQEPICPQDQQNCYEQQDGQDQTSNQEENNLQNTEPNQEEENDQTCSNDQEENNEQICEHCQLPPSDNEGAERPTPDGQQNNQEVGNVPNCSDNQEPICPQDQQNCYEQQDGQDQTSNQEENNLQNPEPNQEQVNDQTCSNDQEENNEQICEHCQLPVNAHDIAGEEEQARNQQNNMEGIPLRPPDEGIPRRGRRNRHVRRDRRVNTIDQRLNIERMRCRVTRICQSLFEMTGASQSVQNEILQFRQILINQAFRRDRVNRNVEQQGNPHPEQNSNPNEGNPNSDR